MKLLLSQSFRILAAVLALAAMGGCPSPASPPSPPAELPSSLVFPPTVGIDVDKIRTPPHASGGLKAFTGEGGEFSSEIAFGGDIFHFTDETLSGVLSFLSGLEIPVGADTAHFEGTVTDEDGSVHGVKIDFGDYDLDRNGEAEGCSGNTGAVPVCYRVWVDGARNLAGVFDAFPTEGNPGKGRFRAGIGSLDEGGGLFAGVAYDHRDPLSKSTEYFLILESGAEQSDGRPEVFFTTHAFAEQVGTDVSADKTLRVSAEDRKLLEAFGSDFTPPSDDEVHEIRYAGRWREDNDFWSGKLESSFDTLDGFPPLCARISTGDTSEDLNCSDLDIGIDGVDFLDFAADGDVGFPETAQFPESPTF